MAKEEKEFESKRHKLLHDVGAFMDTERPELDLSIVRETDGLWYLRNQGLIIADKDIKRMAEKMHKVKVDTILKYN